MAEMKLVAKHGKLPPVNDKRTLRLKDMFRSERPEVPPICDWSEAAGDEVWGTMLNGKSQLNDCTVAAAGHMIQNWTANTGSKITLSDSDILAAYKAISKYDGDEKTDVGATCLAALKYWRKSGIGGHRILSFAELELNDSKLLNEAIYSFGGAYVGIQLPLAAEMQYYLPHEGVTFKTYSSDETGPNKPGTWMHHCVCLVGYSESELVFISWGKRLTMTVEFFNRYCDEAYVALSPDWLNSNEQAPNHIDLDRLKQSMANFTKVDRQ